MALPRKAQVIMEYLTLIGILTAAIVCMLPSIKRGTQSLMKSAADQIGNQSGAEQEITNGLGAYLAKSVSENNAFVDTRSWENMGWRNQIFTERTISSSSSRSNAGWSPE